MNVVTQLTQFVGHDVINKTRLTWLYAVQLGQLSSVELVELCRYKWSLTRDSNPDFPIDPAVIILAAGVGRIAPIMQLIHSLVGISHFAKFREKRPTTVWEMLLYLLKSPITQWRGKWKSYPESMSGTGLPPKVKRFFLLVGPIITPCFNEIGWLLLQ